MSYDNLFCNNLQVTTINGGALTADIAKSNLLYATATVASGATVGLYIANDAGSSASASGANNVATTATLISLDPDDFPTITGIVPKLRLRYIVGTNSVAPAATFQASLYSCSLTGTAAQMIVTANVQTGSISTVTTPAANTKTVAATTTFSIPAEGVYCIGINVSGTTSALTSHTITLELVYESG